jgi:hypothetical protein
MARRWRAEWEKHGRDFGGCHCAGGAGVMRKHRVWEHHSPGKCRLCDNERLWHRAEVRRARREAKRIVREEVMACG